jgi:antitoxin (DNA-binding transcriptional repressor) of toxin-antitoxin stability system
MTVSIVEAQTDLTSLLVKAANGEEVIIEDSGQPIARLVAVSREFAGNGGEPATDDEDPDRKAACGSMKGQIWMADDFDAPLCLVEDKTPFPYDVPILDARK